MGRGDDQSLSSTPPRRGTVVSKESFETRTFEEDGAEIMETRNAAGQLHSPDPAKAARIVFEEDSGGYSQSKQEWYENGQKIRSQIEINITDFDHPGSSTSETMTYDAQGRLHSFDGQPSRFFSEAAGSWQEEYHEHGQLVKTQSSAEEAAVEEARKAANKDISAEEEYKRLFADTVRERAERVMRDKEKRLAASREDEKNEKEEWIPSWLDEDGTPEKREGEESSEREGGRKTIDELLAEQREIAKDAQLNSPPSEEEKKIARWRTEDRRAAEEAMRQATFPRAREVNPPTSLDETTSAAEKEEGADRERANEKRRGPLSRFFSRSRKEEAKDNSASSAEKNKKKLSDFTEGSNEWQELYREEDPEGYQAWRDFTEESYDGDQDGKNS